MKKILIINSDLAKNRGDRAITEGNIQLVKTFWPDSKITGISQYPERDRDWYGIDFIDMNFQSLNPIDLLKLGMQARKSDIVLWGGGEILKDYTNKTALWYWVLKILILRMFNSNIYGAYQGIGPTRSPFSRRIIAYTVNHTKKFIVRDNESKDKLVAWGCEPSKVISASDPAVLPVPEKPNTRLLSKLSAEQDIDKDFLDNFVCIGPRDWFHYIPGGLLPFKYKQKIYKILGKSMVSDSKRHNTYIDNLVKTVEGISKQHGVNILLTPMHMDEGDTNICNLIKERSGVLTDIKILDKDTFSPSELRSVISLAQAMVGFRLHSNIIGISSGVPSANIYYVDKGRVFFDQINQSRYALPIENLLDSNFTDNFLPLFDDLYTNRGEVKASIQKSTSALRGDVIDAFEEVFNANQQ